MYGFIIINIDTCGKGNVGGAAVDLELGLRGGGVGGGGGGGPGGGGVLSRVRRQSNGNGNGNGGGNNGMGPLSLEPGNTGLELYKVGDQAAVQVASVCQGGHAGTNLWPQSGRS